MKKPTRESIFNEASKKLRQDFEAAKNIPHPGEKGRAAEEVLKTFLRGHLPKRFDVCSGFIMDNKDSISGQTDVVIYDANSCPILETFGDNLIIPADNTAVVIEVRSSLDSAGIKDAANKIGIIKSLSRAPIERADTGESLHTLGVLFAFKSTIRLEALADHYAKYVMEKGFGRHIDFIFILDEGMVSLYTHIPGDRALAPIIMNSPNAPVPEGTVIAAGMRYFKSRTLDAFMRFIIPHLQMFLPWISHPGFNVMSNEDSSSDLVAKFLSVKLFEQDPEKRKQLIETYQRRFYEQSLDGMEANKR